MRHLNYNHLLYFHTIAREGSITKAAEVLHLTPQTISGQIKRLEEAVGAPLFERVGRGLVLSETGQGVNQYAEEIFSLGSELAHWVKRGQSSLPNILNIGIVNSIPKLVAHGVLSAGLDLDPPMRLVCKEDTLQTLLADLSIHRLDLVLSDRPIPIGFSVKAFNHPLGESPVAFFGSENLAQRFGADFPGSLDGAPMLLPMTGSAQRRSLDGWFDQIGVAPKIVAEFDDSALLKAFGETGAGIFPAPIAIARQIEQTYHARHIGSAGDITETYYAISPERVLRQAAVRTITDRARHRLSSLTGSRA
ncbi:MAG: transcriptional activator NhaR [Xanthomonadales bacterium]|jgi:LysR family transcriptional activator of nhaA|nr:transcriptional activator NhaR [Xanthomonadales bacterium]